MANVTACQTSCWALAFILGSVHFTERIYRPFILLPFWSFGQNAGVFPDALPFSVDLGQHRTRHTLADGTQRQHPNHCVVLTLIACAISFAYVGNKKPP